MRRTVFICTLIVFSLLGSASTSQAQTTPLEFNDQLVSITDSLYKMGQKWGREFNNSYKANDFSLLTPPRLELERFVNRKIEEVKNMKDVKNSKDLRTAMIEFLQFERAMCDSAFKAVEKLGKDAPSEKIKAAYANLQKFSEKEQGALQKVTIAQEAYAKANGFTIAPAED
jgi:hypothetical protein